MRTHKEIVKDVLQHWNNKDIVSFLTHFGGKFKYILITNTLGTTENDITPGDCRGLSAKLYPLNQFKHLKVKRNKNCF